MGNARWSSVDWNAHATTSALQSRAEIFTQSGMHPDLDPARIEFRESCDSVNNPASTPIILAADETGSMGVLAEHIIKRVLGVVMREIYDRKPVTDPHIMCMGFGDAYYDRAPLQVTQFEASVEPIVEQVRKIWLEGGGGGNNGESYMLPWLFAAYKTRCDAIRLRHRKGYLFTIGDESPILTIQREHIQRFVGLPAERDMDAAAFLADVQKDWHVFHLIVKPVGNQDVVANWRRILGERAIMVDNIENMAESIVSIIQVSEGQGGGDVVASWTGPAQIAARRIVTQLVPAT